MWEHYPNVSWLVEHQGDQGMKTKICNEKGYMGFFMYSVGEGSVRKTPQKKGVR